MIAELLARVASVPVRTKNEELFLHSGRVKIGARVRTGTLQLPRRLRNYSNFGFVLPHSDWLNKLTPPTRPIRRKTKTNHDLVARIYFPALGADYVYLLRVLIA